MIASFGSDNLARWENDGWLHFRSFFTAKEVASINAAVDELWTEKPSYVTVDDLDAGKRCRMSRLDDAARSHRVKISDAYLARPVFRTLLLGPGLTKLLESLLQDVPVLCNSLNLEKSSGQDYHADSLYMTPRTAGGLIACWIALEQVRPEAGPLRLYPGSHRIPSFVFSNGARHAIAPEMKRWASYMQEELDRRNLEPVSVMAEAGDLIVWHGDLLHGAVPMLDPRSSRRSMIAHYFSKSDAVARGYRLKSSGSALWWKRQPQPADLKGRILSAVENRSSLVRKVMRRMLHHTPA